jgi:Type VI secretion system/phage-baseplate injector OB domain
VTDRFLHAFRRHAGAMDTGSGRPRWGIVQSVDPARPAVRVLIQPEGVLTGWLPVVLPWAANGWGLIAVPQPGMTAFVMSDLGSADEGVVVGFAHNDGNPVPVPPAAIGGAAAQVQPGEIALVHASGSVVRLCADGTCTRQR